MPSSGKRKSKKNHKITADGEEIKFSLNANHQDISQMRGYNDTQSQRLLDYDDPEDLEYKPWRCSGWFIVASIFTVLSVMISLVSAAAGGWLRVILSNLDNGWECLGLNIIVDGAIGFGAVGFIFIVVVFKMTKDLLKTLGCEEEVGAGAKCRIYCPYFTATLFVMLVSAALAGVVGLVLSWNYLTVPDLTADYQVPASGSEILKGLDGDDVTIVRDANGIVHISAATQGDAIFGQGFAHGQDRLWEIEFQRLAYKGELAKHLGKAALKFDKQTRTLNFKNAASLLCQNLTANETNVLQRYVDGLNFYLNSTTSRPIEFLFMSRHLLRYHVPEPFDIIDVCGAARLLQWKLSLNINREVERFNIFFKTQRSYDDLWELYLNQTNITGTVLTPEQMDIDEADAMAARRREQKDYDIERTLYSPGGYFYELRSSLMTSVRGMKEQAEEEEDEERRLEEEPDLGLDILGIIRDHASNAWVARDINGQKSCQASDPHLVLNTPSVWHYTHLYWKSDDFDTAGVGMLGIPGVHIGKTTHVSWGITMSMTDLEDLFLLVPSTGSKSQTHYQHNGADVAFKYRTETIAVKGSDDVVLSVKESVYGPVCTEALGLPKPKHLNFAVRSRPLLKDDSSLTAIVNMINPQVRTAKDVRDMIFANMQSPGFSIPTTDENGQLAYTMTGKHIIRAVGHTGWIPTLGNGTFDWQGSIPFHQLPTTVIDASKDRAAISCANQKIYPDGYNYTLGYDFCYPYRGRRLHQLVNASNQTQQLSSLAHHVDVQTDIQSNMWVDYFAALLLGESRVVHRRYSRDVMPFPAPFRSSLNEHGLKWLNRLEEWDGRSRMGAIEPTFFWFWYRQLGKYPTDVLTAMKKELWTDHNYPFRTLASPTKRMEQDCGSYALANNISMGIQSTSHPCYWVAVSAFNALAEQYSDENTVPLWGIEVNRIDATNLMMHHSPLKCMFDLKANKDGDHTSIDVADPGTLSGDIPVKAASSMRQVYSWSTPHAIDFALPGGENENPFSPFYSNLLQPYVRDEYKSVAVLGGIVNVTSVHSKQTLKRTKPKL